MRANMLIGIVVMLIFSIPMVIFSIVLLTGRGASLLAGFNEMSPAERAGWNTKAMCRFMGVVLLVFTILLAVSALSAFSGVIWLMWSAFGVAVAELIGGVIYLNKSGRFRK